MLILFPSKKDNNYEADIYFEIEYEIAMKIEEFSAMLFNYDDFISGNGIRLNSNKTGLCIYRGWMLSPSKYMEFYNQLFAKGIRLINSPSEYDTCHLFPNIYSDIKPYTPKCLYYKHGTKINWEMINVSFKKFMIKDYVKSAKNLSIPMFYETPVNCDEMNKYIEMFIKQRGEFYTGGIVIKEYVDLKKYFGMFTNEFRAFYMWGYLLSLSPNSNQPETCETVPIDFVNKFSTLKSNFYTVDFAELSNGQWIIIEVGDGQVSGVSTGLEYKDFYQDLLSSL